MNPYYDGVKKIRIVAMVQARTSSARLPGKVLKPILGKPMILYLLESLKQCYALDDIVLTTSDHFSDDMLAMTVMTEGYSCFRGELNGVASRILKASETYKADAVIRLSGDSPLLDYRLVDHAIDLFRKNNVDLVTNVAERTFPKGQSVEIFSIKTLKNMVLKGLSAEENEHVTLAYYKNPEQFEILNFENKKIQGDIQISVDTLDEFNLCEAIIKKMIQPHWSYDLTQVLDLRTSLLEEENAAL